MRVALKAPLLRGWGARYGTVLATSQTPDEKELKNKARAKNEVLCTEEGAHGGETRGTQVGRAAACGLR